MKINYDNIKETKPRWKVGDVIYSTTGYGLYLVANVDDSVRSHSYTLVNLENGRSSKSYGTVNELQHCLCDESDIVLTGTFKYIGADNDIQCEQDRHNQVSFSRNEILKYEQRMRNK